MGFDAVYISPTIKNAPGGYHGYWPSNFNEVNEYFGSEQDLIDLINACHKRGLWIMVDVNVNHVTYV